MFIVLLQFLGQWTRKSKAFPKVIIVGILDRIQPKINCLDIPKIIFWHNTICQKQDTIRQGSSRVARKLIWTILIVKQKEKKQDVISF